MRSIAWKPILASLVLGLVTPWPAFAAPPIDRHAVPVDEPVVVLDTQAYEVRLFCGRFAIDEHSWEVSLKDPNGSASFLVEGISSIGRVSLDASLPAAFDVLSTPGIVTLIVDDGSSLRLIRIYATTVTPSPTPPAFTCPSWSPGKGDA